MPGKAVPIRVGYTLNNSQPELKRYPENQSEVFKELTPVFLDASGGVTAWSGVVATSKVAGIAYEPSSNLTTEGVTKVLTYGSVANQASAVKIPRGAPINDGKNGVMIANRHTVFTCNLLDTQVSAMTQLLARVGLTKDSNNYWYVDITKTDACQILSFDPRYPIGTLGHPCYFIFIDAAMQLGG